MNDLLMDAVLGTMPQIIAEFIETKTSSGVADIETPDGKRTSVHTADSGLASFGSYSFVPARSPSFEQDRERILCDVRFGKARWPFVENGWRGTVSCPWRNPFAGVVFERAVQHRTSFPHRRGARSVMISEHVIAENVIEQFDCRLGMRIISFDYPCPNCGAQHSGREKQMNWDAFDS